MRAKYQADAEIIQRDHWDRGRMMNARRIIAYTFANAFNGSAVPQHRTKDVMRQLLKTAERNKRVILFQVGPDRYQLDTGRGYYSFSLGGDP